MLLTHALYTKIEAETSRPSRGRATNYETETEIGKKMSRGCLEARQFLENYISAERLLYMHVVY